MTPTATTPAGRSASGTRHSADARSPRTPRQPDPGVRRTPRQPGTPRKPGTPRIPRRVSGPATGRVREAPVATRIARPRRRAAFLRDLPDHPLLDRLVRGRAWIPLLGVMLAGIVAMQVEVLKLGASIGRSIERSTALQSRNELLRESVASLADEQRIERLASGLGMVMPTPGAVGFLAARRSVA